MPVRKMSGGNRDSLRVAGLILRRNPEQEFHSYIPLLPYHPGDYQVLLRNWPSPPFQNYLGAFSGPALSGQDPQTTLAQESYNWSRRLAQHAKLGEDAPGVSVRRTEFISVHGGGRQVDPISGENLEMGVVLCYVLPTTTRESSVVSRYPTSPDYPQFYDLAAVLRGMTSLGTLNVHPYTREMLSALDRWLREQHDLPGAINFLFSPSLESRLKMYVTNPLHEAPPVDTPTHENGVSTPDTTVVAKKAWSFLSSTPFQRPSEDSTLHETTMFSMAKLSDTLASMDKRPADVIVKNPIFGSGLKFSKVDVSVVNEHFGHGAPDYDVMGEKRGKWAVHVEGDGMPDWVDRFPMHKCACEGDEEGVRRCVRIGVSPDERDTDSWTPLHYACWYGELDIVKVLVEEASASLGMLNSSDSTPLHLAAATGHIDVVAYLLQQPGIQLVQTAIDNEGKSPLAVCLECRMNDWSGTAKLLREAYKTMAHNLPHSPSLLPSPHDYTHSPEPVPFQSNLESLSLRGSQGNLTNKAVTPRKKKDKMVRRQRVDFMSGQHQLAHFFKGKDTPTTDVLQDIYKLIRLSPQFQTVFALWITSESLELQLGDGDKPLQLLSTWPSLLSRHIGKTTVTEVPSLYVRRNVFFSVAVERTITDPIALELLYADAQRHVLTGQYPCTEVDAIYLGGLSMQVSYGDHAPMVHRSGFLQGQLGRVLPVAMATSRRRVEFERRVLTQHSQISQDCPQSEDSQEQLYRMYLQKCWQWPFYGAAFFPGSLATKSCKIPTQVKLGRKAHVPVSIAVNTLGFHLITMETNSLVVSLSYEAVEWDVSSKKQQLLLLKKDKSLHILVHTKMAGLLYTLVSRMTEQYLHHSHGNTSATPTPHSLHNTSTS